MSRMTRLVVGIVALAAGQAALAQAPTTNEYFPLKLKSKWTYKVQDQIVEVVVSSVDKLPGGNEEATKVDTIVNSKVVASEWYQVKPDGVYRVKVKDDKIDPAVKILANPPKKGAEWEVKSKVGNQMVTGKFKVTESGEKMPAPMGILGGVYEIVLVEGVDMDIAGTKATIKTWYSKNIGIVKLSFKIQDSESVLELVKYEEGK